MFAIGVTGESAAIFFYIGDYSSVIYCCWLISFLSLNEFNVAHSGSVGCTTVRISRFAAVVRRCTSSIDEERSLSLILFLN